MLSWSSEFRLCEQSTDAGDFAYWQAGEGPAVWCLHGFPDTAETWIELAQTLCHAGYSVYVPHMPGYLIGNGLADYSVPALAKALLVLIEQVCPDQKVRLIGHDWGAVCAYAMAAIAPERIERMICAAVPHPKRFLNVNVAQLKRSWYMGFFQLPYWPERRIRADQQAFVERLWRDWSPQWAFSPEDIAATKRALAQRSVCKAALAYYRALPRTLLKLDGQERRQLFAPTGVATLAIAGEDDGCIGVDMFREQDACFAAEYQFLVLKQAGHFMHREQAPAFAAASLEFFA